MKKILILMSLLVTAVAYGATTYTTNYNLAKPGDRDRNYGSLIRGDLDTIDTQMKSNADATTAHIADAVGAHAATAIVTTPGVNICTTQITAQDYLDCLDALLDPASSGVVLITGAQTITGLKTFQVAPIFTSVPSGILNTDAGGGISANTFAELSPLTTKGDLLAFDTAETRIGVGTDGYSLEADSTTGTGLVWAEPNPKWRKFTFTFSDFSAASLTFAVTAFALQAEEGIDSVVVKHTTAFSGGAITAYNVKVGQTGNIDKYASMFDVFIAPANTLSSVNNVMDVPNFGATTDVVVTATSVGANLDQASAGSVDVYVRTFKLP